jgi:dihydroxyacetone kinase
MLQNAYLILATGDHDYQGHRVRAMHQIEAAAKLLGMTLSGDAKDRQPQPLSDAKLREAQGLLQNVLGAAEVKNQVRITKHINNAINQINIALSIR